ncbi:LOW QUALITY PROTEIN: GTP cyclohydrolase I type 1 [Vibrio sp. JCM 18905]|nr:LOW QUALITY PROTEIN: GTP cyclohydrolase I type 1 [Vibrio sp. JCM 18905]
MSGLSESAKLVKEALEQRGLETPMRPNAVSREEKKEKIEYHMREILGLLQLDLTMIARKRHTALQKCTWTRFSLVWITPTSPPKITVIENKMNVSEMVRVKDITVTSTCEHHLVTIDGKAAVAYIPRGKIIGLSKINRIVRFFAQRLQVQERMTQQILVALQTLLESDDVAVTIDATHYCVKSRGVMDATSETTTTALGGIFKSNPATRAEFLHGLR